MLNFANTSPKLERKVRILSVDANRYWLSIVDVVYYVNVAWFGQSRMI
jgi:hypothetical protein